MPKIFISYRREDSQWPAHSLHQSLKRHVTDARNDLFIDVDNIPLGVNFAQHLETQVARCDILLALIGQDWLSIRNTETGARRLDDPADFVRIEIASALRRGIPVVPVLLDGARVPRADDLPPDLRELSMRNAVEIRRPTFEADAARLIDGLGLSPDLALTAKPRLAPAKPPERRNAGKVPFLTFGLATVAVLAAVVWLFDPLRWRTHPQLAATSPSASAPLVADAAGVSKNGPLPPTPGASGAAPSLDPSVHSPTSSPASSPSEVVSLPSKQPTPRSTTSSSSPPSQPVQATALPAKPSPRTGPLSDSVKNAVAGGVTLFFHRDQAGVVVVFKHDNTYYGAGGQLDGKYRADGNQICLNQSEFTHEQCLIYPDGKHSGDKFILDFGDIDQVDVTIQ